MPLIKQIHKYVINSFLRTFAITFLGSIFVLVMQFMFRYVDDLVGKGVGIGVLAEFFLYAALSIIPIALPLSILLGSLMTYGNLGERFELLAMKAAGVSLFHSMRSLIILISFISVASFFFADNVLPKTQVRMWTLLFSIREKSPELDIPEGSFYNGISGRNLYVGDKEGHFLKDIIIYDYSRGFNNTSIIIADTGTIQLSKDKQYLMLNLTNGETFENMQQGNSSGDTKIIPYRRETFKQKNIVIDFDANFKEMSSEFLEGQYVSKNTTQLQYTIDSISNRLDSTSTVYKNKNVNRNYFENGGNAKMIVKAIDTTDIQKYDYKIAYYQLDSLQKIKLIENAMSRVASVNSEILYRASTYDWDMGEIRKHAIEWYKRFTLSFACLIFLFIGAPLGAIIRKGGMGIPIVISTILFIVYYIIDNAGYKMAREGIWPVPAGMWLSAAVLLPFGILLTYMAATDSTFMSGEAMMISIKKFFRKENIIFVYYKKIKQKLRLCR
ncbi:MAG: YjgP/YjgQ family permease [Bacteroidia bacterium]|nr:YjgP/YjgQ family permease [Bacteroidia bacterium]